MSSKKIKIYPVNEFRSVPVIKRSEFFVDRKSLIGAGQQAKVYKGAYNGIMAAIKIVSLYHSDSDEVLKEIKVIKSIDNKYFTLLMAICYEAEQIYLILKYFESVCLYDLIAAVDPELNHTYKHEERKSKIAFQICSAVSFIHEKGIVHRDIKPHNILVNEAGEVKLCDFGISKYAAEQAQMQTTLNGRSVGTDVYKAPEILLHGVASSFPSDVWSVGCIIVEIFKGSSLWKIKNVKMLQDVLIVQQKPNLGSIPLQIRFVVDKYFSYQPECSPSAKEVADALKDFMRNPL